MNYEEKLEEAKRLYETANDDQKHILESLFPELPELTESEDERIRKNLITCISTFKHPLFSEIERKEFLTWLEKQKAIDVLDAEERGFADNVNSYRKDMDEFYKKGYDAGREAEKQYWLEKQDNNIYHSVDKVEPKFKVGNWYQCTKDFFGKGVTFDKNTAYYCAKEGYLQDEYGCHIAIVKDLYDNFKLWTIQDAKDGDVLVSDLCDVIILFRGIKNNTIDFYCDYDFSEFDMPGDRFTVNTDRYYGTVDDSKDIHPATKEQRDTLFAKMKEAGYERDAEKKELKKIEQESIESGDIKNVLLVHDEILNNLFERYKTSATFKTFIVNLQNWWNNTRRHLLSFNVGQKPTAWSEEDELQMQGIIDLLPGLTNRHNWLKSLKNRVILQPKQEWSEGDNAYKLFTLSAVEEYYDEENPLRKGIIDWLNSLKQRINDF